jgi:hypothetical protein
MLDAEIRIIWNDLVRGDKLTGTVCTYSWYFVASNLLQLAAADGQ